MITTEKETKVHTCYHCGNNCEEEIIVHQGKEFCCYGCKTVFEILSENNLCEYYDLTQQPGISQRKNKAYPHFEALDNEIIRKEYILFADGNTTSTEFSLPQMHCSSCIWLLENLNRINKSIISSRVDFPQRKVSIVFKEKEMKLSEVATLLANVGYEPHLSHNEKRAKKQTNTRIYKIGIAGFAFANIMMLSLPDYFADGKLDNETLKHTFIYISLALSIPVFFYSATEFFISAWQGLKRKFLNIDAPIALAVAVTFFRSIYEILSGTGPGYLDSMSGIVFFMLAGRWFQDRSYRHLSFDRDYRSYFPVSVSLLSEDSEKQVPLSEIKPGDRIRIRNEEHICADSILLNGNAAIDYSFVTGESEPVMKTPGEIIYAGGKQTGSAIDVEVVKAVSQSYITQLWNNPAFDSQEEKNVSFVHALSKYFTIIVLAISALAAIYWMIVDPSKALNAFTAPLIVACPCALLLSATFCNGNVIRKLGNNGIYLKNSGVTEVLADADVIVLDKTGTLTLQGSNKMFFHGNALNDEESQMIKSAVLHSSHPYSKMIYHAITGAVVKPDSFIEIPGKGIEAAIKGSLLKIGSSAFVTGDSGNLPGVYVSINGILKGRYIPEQQYRSGLAGLIKDLSADHELYMLSGDDDSEREHLMELFPDRDHLLFRQTPVDKLEFVQKLQAEGKKVIMIGDGLNDAGALMKSNAGIAISNEINNFFPACDAILKGSELVNFSRHIKFAVTAERIILGSFVISIVYNIIGLWFAVSGTLQPVIAAILMPCSTVSIILFTVGLSSLAAKRMKRDINHVAR